MQTVINLFWNSHEQRIRAFWRLLVLFVCFMFFSIALGLVFAIPFFVGMAMQDGTATVSQDMFLFAVTLASLPATLGSMWLVGHFIDRRPFADFGFHLHAGWWRDLGFGLLLGAALMLGVFLVELAAGWITITDTFQSGNAAQPFVLAILAPLILFLSVGIYEEALTRGYLLRNVAEGLNLPRIGAQGAIVIAWIISSAIFGLLHAGNPNATWISTFNITLAGLFLGLAYILTGELAIPIGIHITWNFFQGNVFGFPVSGANFSPATFVAIEQRGPALWTGGEFGPEAGLIGIIAMLVGSACILLWVRFQHNSLGLHLPLAHFSARHTDEVPQKASRVEA